MKKLPIIIGGTALLTMLVGETATAGDLKSNIHHRLAITYGARKQFAQAEGELKKAEHLLPPGPSPERASIERDLGFALYQQKKWAEAITYLGKNLAGDPSGYRDLLARADCNLHLDREKEGLADLKKIRAGRPGVPQTYEILADYYERRGDYSKAIAELTIVINSDNRKTDHSRDLLKTRSRLYGLNGQRDLALRDRDRLKDLDAGLNGLFLPKH